MLNGMENLGHISGFKVWSCHLEQLTLISLNPHNSPRFSSLSRQNTPHLLCLVTKPYNTYFYVIILLISCENYLSTPVLRHKSLIFPPFFTTYSLHVFFLLQLSLTSTPSDNSLLSRQFRKILPNLSSLITIVSQIFSLST